MSDLIKKGKCAKCNDYVSLGNDSHISTYVVHNNNGCWKVVCNFYSVVNNVGRALVKKNVLMLGSTDIDMINNSDI